MEHRTTTTHATRALWTLLALVLFAFSSVACEREEKCQCSQLFPEDTDPEDECEDCICPADTILLGLGPKGVQNEVDCIDDESCGAGFECREAKCVNIEKDNPNRFHACVKASGVLEGRYMLWDEEQRKRVECGYRDGKRHEYCDVYDASENRLHHCIYQDGTLDLNFSVGICKASCAPTPGSVQFQVLGTRSTDIYPIHGCNANGVPLPAPSDGEEETDADAGTDDATTDDATTDDATTGDATTDDATTDDASTDATTADAADDATTDATTSDASAGDATDDAATDAADDATTDAATDASTDTGTD